MKNQSSMTAKDTYSEQEPKKNLKRKFLLISTLLIVLLSITASTVFANNALNTIGNVAEDVTSAAGNVLTTGVDAVRNTVDDVANGTMRASNNVATGITNMGNNNRSGNGNTGYTATRTNTNATWLGMDATMWTWLIMAILGVAIVAMIWFYAKQDNTEQSEQHYEE